MVARHESLRTHFAEVEGAPVQVIAPAAPVALAVEDLSSLSAAEQAAQVQAVLAAERTTPFDLARGPVYRVRLLRGGPTDHILVRTLHHIVSDGWSEAVFSRDLLTLYAAAQAGTPAPLAPLPVQYADFACWQRAWLDEAAMATGLAYWTQQLAGRPAQLTLPTDRPRPATPTFAAGVYQQRLTAGEVAALHAVSRQAGTTLFMTLLAGFAALLARYSGQDDVVVGTPIANRQDAQVEGLIGFFVNSLVLRVRVGATETWPGLLAQVRATLLAAYQHQDVPFERLVEVLAPARHVAQTPVFQVSFALQNTP
jgi:hypothetical protein